MFSRTANTEQNHKNSSLFQTKKDTSTFVQPKLNIGKPGDKYEVEADKAADQIVAKGKENSSAFLAPAPTIQKQTEDDVQKQEGENEIQQKPVVDKITPGVQLKPEESLQTKEDEEVQMKDEEDIQTKEEELQMQSEEDLQQKAESDFLQQKENTSETNTIDSTPEIKPVIQKQAEEDIQTKEEEEIQEKEDETLQKQSTSAGDDGSGIESQLSDSKGGGSPMSSETQSEMESGFGADFSGVRVHNDSNAVQMNQELGSQAFTNGNDIYFNEGKYNPDSDSGKHLLAHELTHTVQQGASPNNSVQTSKIVQKEEAKEPAKPGVPTTVIDLNNGLKMSKDWLDYLEANPKEKTFDVKVKLGTMYTGTISLKKLGKAKEGETQKFELASKTKRYLDIQGMEFLNPLKNAQVYPILVLNNFGDAQTTSGFLSVRKGQTAVTTNALGVIDSINANLEKMGFLGIDKINTGGLENKYENGGLNFKANELSVNVDGYVEASGSLGITNSAFTFDVTSNIEVAGLAQGEFNLKRDEKGQLSGKASISADIANVNASVTVEYDKGAVTIQGTGKMSSEKFSGEITLLVTDEAKSKQMMHAALGVESMEAEKKAPANPAAPVKKTKGNQVLAGWGTVEATITPWLQGTANVGIDNKGQVTIVGTITVPNEVPLMEQRGIKHDLFDVEIRAGYGIPLVGQVFLFASIGMFMNAGFGPLVLKDVAFTGTYSTDPNVLQNFSITGTLGINAFAILGLKAEAGVGVTLLGHDVKAGVSVTAAAGIKAYAEATPTFQYQEQKSPQGGKVGESRLKGHFEAAAQLFLQLSGSLFYELDSPWWSPAPDGREDYPLGEVQYPIGDSMGIGADVDWLVGSKEAPELKFSPVEFDPNKFTADVMADPPPRKMGKSDQEPKGKFEDKGGGDQQKDPKATGNGKGLPPNSKKQEDLKNLPDDQKYLRGLDELSKLEKADPKPTVAVVEAKMQKVKSKYGLQTVKIKSKKDGEVTVYVKHKKQDNNKNLLKIKTMSEAERKKLLGEAMTDLGKRETKIVDKEGKTEEAKAKDMLQGWAKAHPIIESAKVVDGKTTWDYLIDIGDKNETQKGKLKSGAEGDGKGDKDNLDNTGKEVLDKILKMEVPFTNKSEETHKLDFDLKGDKIILFRKSIPQDIETQINAIKQAINNEEGKTEEAKVGAKVLATVEEAWQKIETILNTDIMPLFKRMKKVEGKPDQEVSDNSFSIKKGDEIKTHLTSIAKVLDDIPEIVDGKFLKDSKQIRPESADVKFAAPVTRTMSDGTATKDGTKMTAPVLSRVGPSNTKGSQPNSAGYSALYRDLIENGVKVVAAHLLNHQLFGRGNNVDNLTPLPSLLNNPTMEKNMEEPVKKAVLQENKVVFYEVVVNYANSRNAKITPNDVMIPGSITATAYELETEENATDEEKGKAENWTKKGDTISTTPVTVTEDDIKGKEKPSETEVIDMLMGRMDEMLAKSPEINWEDFRSKNIGHIAKLSEDSRVSLKQDFFKKKDKLGTNYTIEGPTSYEEVVSNVKTNLNKVGDNIKTKSTKEEVITYTSNGIKNDFSIGTPFKNVLAHGPEDMEGAKQTANNNKDKTKVSAQFKKQSYVSYLVKIGSIKLSDEETKSLADAPNNTIKYQILGRIVKANKSVIKTVDDSLKTDLSNDLLALLMMTWSHVNKDNDPDNTETQIKAHKDKLTAWNASFETTDLQTNEKNLNTIENGTGGIKELFNSQNLNLAKKQELEKQLNESKSRLKLKQGDLETAYQKILRQIKLDQDNLEEYKADTVNGHPQLANMDTYDISTYTTWRLGLILDNLGLTDSKKSSLTSLYAKLSEKAGTLLRS
jgi:hypothetical protein